MEGLESFATGFAIARSAFSHGQWRNRIGGKNHAMFTFCWQMSEQSSILLWARDETRSRHYDTATPSGGRGPRHQIDSLCTRLPVEKRVGRDGDSGAQKDPRERSRLHLRNGGNLLWVILFPLHVSWKCGSTRLPWSFVPSLVKPGTRLRPAGLPRCICHLGCQAPKLLRSPVARESHSDAFGQTMDQAWTSKYRDAEEMVLTVSTMKALV